ATYSNRNTLVTVCYLGCKRRDCGQDRELSADAEAGVGGGRSRQTRGGIPEVGDSAARAEENRPLPSGFAGASLSPLLARPLAHRYGAGARARLHKRPIETTRSNGLAAAGCRDDVHHRSR